MSNVTLKNLNVGYGRNIVIKDINLTFESGNINTIIGPNGSGKSTILKTIIREILPLSGDIFIDDKNLKNISQKNLSKKIAIVMTDKINSDRLTVREILESGRYPYTGSLGILSKKDKEITKKSAEITSVTEILNRDFNNLSDGQKQRVILAKAICQEPDILILDEPTSFLDIHHKVQLLNILSTFSIEKNVTVIMSLHEINLAKKISDKIITVKNGKIDAVGIPGDILTNDYITRLFDIEKNDFEKYFR